MKSEVLQKILETTKERVTAWFPELLKKMRFFLEQPQEYNELYKPIKENILKTFEDTNYLIHSEYDDSLPRVDISEITKVLDSALRIDFV